MMRGQFLCCVVCSLLLADSFPRPARAAEFAFHEGDRVVLLGATTIERAQAFGYLETELTRRNPGRNVSFRNLGWSGDTVWADSRGLFDQPTQGYQRMLEQVRGLKPTVILLAYGSNEAFAGSDGLPRFEDQLGKLINDLSSTKARIVLVSPHLVPKLDPPLPDPARHNRDLELYSTSIGRIAEDRKLQFVDLADETPPLPPGHMHLGAEGNRRYARAFDAGLHGAPLPNVAIELSSKGDVVRSQGAKTTRLNPDARSVFRVEVHMQRLPAPVSPAKRAGGWTLTVKGLSPTRRFTLNSSGQGVATASGADWQQGVRIVAGPDVDQTEALRQAIVKKNEYYFHRWRPQNVTYLFLFRKHEQGQNAKEVPEFDKLVAQQEAKIAKLRVPKTHQYEIVVSD